MDIGAKIRNMRTLKNLSQENMKDMLGISFGAYGKIERGQTDIPFSRLMQIAEKLEVSLPELLQFGESGMVYINGNVSHGSVGAGSNTFNTTKEEVDMMVELSRLRAENEGFKKEITHFGEIIALMKNKA